MTEPNSFNFGEALHQLKHGHRVARIGWNGAGQWLTRIHPGNAMHLGFDMQECIGLKNSKGQMQPGWVPSQGDMFAEDWVMVR